MAREEFQKELQDIHKDILRMGTGIECSIDMLTEAFSNQDLNMLAQVVARDDSIDEYEAVLEKKCLSVIIRQQPVAKDLRMVATVLKIITDMERIADHCADIAEYIISILHQSTEKYRFDINEILKMFAHVKKMVTGTIDCYVNLDAQRAVEISLEDDIADEYFTAIMEDIRKKMENDATCIYQGIRFLYIIKYIERMADHATNICEWVAFEVTGEHKQYN